jgi:hypothetical protein
LLKQTLHKQTLAARVAQSSTQIQSSSEVLVNNTNNITTTTPTSSSIETAHVDFVG